MRTLARHTHRFRDVGNRLTGLDPIDDQSAGIRREPSVTVRHEDLLVSGDGNPHITREVLIASTDTNVTAKYS